MGFNALLAYSSAGAPTLPGSGPHWPLAVLHPLRMMLGFPGHTGLRKCDCDRLLAALYDLAAAAAMKLTLFEAAHLLVNAFRALLDRHVSLLFLVIIDPLIGIGDALVLFAQLIAIVGVADFGADIR